MERILNSELALLSLIAEQPRHAYQIEQVIEERNMRYWTDIGFSSIYRLLSKLEQSGWISGKLNPPEGRGPARKVYQLTPTGKEVWQQAALFNLAEPERKYSSFLLGLDNLSVLPSREVLNSIKINLTNQQTIYKQLSQAVQEHPMRDDFYISIFFDYLLNQLAVEIRWLKELIGKLEKHDHKV